MRYLLEPLQNIRRNNPHVALRTYLPQLGAVCRIHAVLHLKLYGKGKLKVGKTGITNGGVGDGNNRWRPGLIRMGPVYIGPEGGTGVAVGSPFLGFFVGALAGTSGGGGGGNAAI
jgi:hypothetical protein